MIQVQLKRCCCQTNWRCMMRIISRLDMGRAAEVAVDCASEVARRIGEMRERIPPPQGLAVASLFIAVPDDFPREVFQRPLGEDALTRPRVMQLLRDLDVLG